MIDHSIFNFRNIYSGSWCQVIVECGNRVVGRSHLLLSSSHKFEERVQFFIDSYLNDERKRNDTFSKYISQVRGLRRKHADFYLMHNNMGDTKEISMSMRLSNYFESDERYAVNYKKPLNPHPDVEIYNNDGSVFAVEVTELVNNEAVASHIRYSKFVESIELGGQQFDTEKERFLYSEYLAHLLDWSSETFKERIEECIRSKDMKYIENLSDRSNYIRTILLIHTNEPRLSTLRIEEYLGHSGNYQSEYFDDVFLVWFSSPKSNVKKIN